MSAPPLGDAVGSLAVREVPRARASQTAGELIKVLFDEHEEDLARIGGSLARNSAVYRPP